MSRALLVIAVLLVGSLQMSMLAHFGNVREYLNIILIFAVYATMVQHYERGLLIALIGGVLFDLYSAQPFGTFAFAYIVAVVVTFLVFKNYLTNRSVASLFALMAIATITYRLSLVLILGIWQMLGTEVITTSVGVVTTSTLMQLLVNCSVAIVIAFLLRFVAPSYSFQRLPPRPFST